MKPGLGADAIQPGVRVDRFRHALVHVLADLEQDCVELFYLALPPDPVRIETAGKSADPIAESRSVRGMGKQH